MQYGDEEEVDDASADDSGPVLATLFHSKPIAKPEVATKTK